MITQFRKYLFGIIVLLILFMGVFFVSNVKKGIRIISSQEKDYMEYQRDSLQKEYYKQQIQKHDIIQEGH